MFDKLFGMINKIEAEPVKARPAEKVSQSVKAPESKSDGKGTLIGYDYLKKSEVGREDRIQSKMELLKQLQEELDYYE